MFSANLISRSFYLSAGLGVLALLSMPVQLVAQTGKSLTSFDNICLAEAKRAETRHGIPSGLLQSITRVESGRKMITGEYMPWAWTLNDRGEGLFFDDREAALAYLRNAVAKPEHSVDVGCMQVNTKWHADGFPDLADMLDPVHNASYAAGFLLDLHAAHQSWDEAVKHYHSSEPRKNVAYHRRVLAELERFIGELDMADDAPIPALPGEAEEAGVEMAAARATNRPMTQTPAVFPSTNEAGSTDLELITGAPGAMPAPMQTMVSPAPDADMHGRDPLAPVGVSPSAAPSSTVPSAAMPRGNKPVAGRVASQAGEDDALLENQPNLAPHRSRVEHFRRLLAQQAG
jgi:hypothetical protein